MMRQYLIRRFKQLRRAPYLAAPESFYKRYAVVGTGDHAIANLYPALLHLGVPISVVVSQSAENARRMALRVGASGSHDLRQVLTRTGAEAIDAVVLCAPAAIQHELALQILEAGKALYVEKPPAPDFAGLNKLITIAQQKGQPVVVGLQQRYAPAIAKLRRALRLPQHYQLTYATGPYPEGDIATELWIHPLDLCLHLFGPLTDTQILVSPDKQTLALQVCHASGVVGQISLSQALDWQAPVQQLRVTDTRGLYELSDLAHLSFRPRPSSPLGLPLDKVFPKPQQTQQLFAQSAFLPVAGHSSLAVHGYINALQTFVQLTEGKRAQNLSAPSQLTDTYRLLEAVSASLAKR